MPEEYVKEKGIKFWRQRFSEVEQEANTFKDHWKEIVDYFAPRKGRYLYGESEQHNDGRKKHDKILNGSASGALRTLAAGMHGGLTSPSRPWFTLKLPNEELAEISSVRKWLHDVRQLMLSIFAKSNFYVSVHNLYKELGAFGVASMVIDKDPINTIRCKPFTIGEFYLSLDSRYVPSELYRRYEMTAKQMVEKFGKDNVSDKVLSTLKTAPEKYFTVVNIITPNMDYVDSGYTNTRGYEYADIHYEEHCGDEEKFLAVKYYASKPFVASRWDVTGDNTYGDSPAMEALADNKMLQKMEEKKLKAIGKKVDPPMNAPASMREEGGTIIEGGINYIDPTAGNQSFAPAYQVNLQINELKEEIREVENRIDEFFYNPLFLAVIQSDRSNMTAYEVAKRLEEKIVMLGPVLDRMQSEMLDPIIDRVFNILQEEGLLPEIPPELEGADLKIEYISLLAQAQKQVGTTSLLQTMEFVGAIAKLNPESLDKFDADEAIDQYSEMVGSPPSVVRSDDDVADLRQQRAQAQQQAAMREMMGPAAKAAKDMAGAKMGTGSALDGFIEGAESE